MIVAKILGTVAVLSLGVVLWAICGASVAEGDKKQTYIAIIAFHLGLFFLASLLVVVAAIWEI